MEIKTMIVGTQHIEGGLELISRLRRGDPIILRREPANQYDRMAVACYYGPDKIGYIPSKSNPPIALAMDEGKAAAAEIADEALIRGTTGKQSIASPARILVTVGEVQERLLLMADPNPIVGHKTFRDDEGNYSHEPIRGDEADE